MPQLIEVIAKCVPKMDGGRPKTAGRGRKGFLSDFRTLRTNIPPDSFASRREKPTPADNPAVLRLVQDMMHAAQTRGVPLYLCGIMQKDLETMPAFMRIGVRNFCVESVHINTLKSILMQTEL